MSENKQKYVKSLESQLTEFREKFSPIEDCIRTVEVSDDLEEKYKSLKDRLNEFEWRIQHFQKEESEPDEIVRPAFQDMTDEIEWRLREVQKLIKGEDLCDEDETPQLAKNFRKRNKPLNGNQKTI